MAAGEELAIAAVAAGGGTETVDTAVAREAAAIQLTPESSRHVDRTRFGEEIRMIDSNTLIGKWRAPFSTPWVNLPGLETTLNGYVQRRQSDIAFHFLLKRVE
jgi:hypothetical protein